VKTAYADKEECDDANKHSNDGCVNCRKAKCGKWK
jgi:cysteine-rich repeat protein